MNEERITLSKYNKQIANILEADKLARQKHSLKQSESSNTKASKARAITDRFLLDISDRSDEVWMLQGDLKTRLEDGFGTFCPPLIDTWLETARKDRGELHQCPSMMKRR